jgi:hypothetical protein
MDSFFIFAMSQFDWPITQKKKLWRLPEIEGSILKYRVSPLWPNYTGERRKTFAKAYGIKVRCYGEYVGQHNGNLRNLIGTHWEHSGNTLGTTEK